MLFQILTISRFTIIESLRNRILWLAFLIIGVSFVLVEFIGSLTITEHRVTQVAILAAFLRLSAVVIITLFVVTSVVRELHDKTLEMILAMALHRSSYYVGKLFGFLCIAVMISIIFSMLILLYADTEQVLIWMISLFLELVIVVALSLIMLFSFHQIPAALTGVFIIYGASRVISSMFLMAKYPVFADTSIAQQFINGFIEFLSWLLPDLHRFTKTEWLAYNTADWGTLLPLFGQALIYLLFLSFITLFDFYRKNF